MVNWHEVMHRRRTAGYHREAGQTPRSPQLPRLPMVQVVVSTQEYSDLYFEA